MRAKRIAYTSITQFLNVIATVIAGFVLPRLILTNFGSDYYGIIAAITQFMGYGALLVAGVGGATRAALYKPLAEQNNELISGIMCATMIFMRKVAFVFVGILIVVAAIYPLLVSEDFEWFFVFSLILILGGGSFITFFFGAAYSMLIQADQRFYITTIVSICTVALNIGIAALLILAGNEIRVVYLASLLVFAINPIYIYIYARKRYKFNHAVAPNNNAIRQRWDAFAHEIVNFINRNAPIVILTIFVGIFEVAVYALYHLIISKIMRIINSLVGGMIPAFGDMIAKNEHKTLQKGLTLYDFVINSLSILLITCTILLIVPFVTVFTLGIDDANYYRPLFAVIACSSLFVTFAGVPHFHLIHAAGHFKQTKYIIYAELAIGVTLAITLVQWFGIVGVALGMLCATIFRTIALALYASKHLVKRSMWVFVRRMLVSLLTAGVIIAIAQLLPTMAETTYVAWILHALPVFGTAVAVTALSTLLFYREEARMLFTKVRGVVRR
ncbi:MAG: hypothetical protein FWC13_00685 [Oscillospiraceae bacterium]|nr:hypothetical protein [Oscillospiraceae bacterium]